MKKLALIFTLFNCLTFWGQPKHFKSDLNSFLIGLMGDYDGKMAPYDHPTVSVPLTTFFCDENNYTKVFLDSINKIKNIEFKIEVENNSIYSEKLSKYFNKFYKKELIPDYGFYDTIQKKDYNYYFLILDKSKFKTSDKKLSFLLGTYYRYGTFNDKNEITLSFINSNSHFVVCKLFVEKLGFKFIKEELSDYYSVPSTQSFTFIPSDNFISIFKEVDSKKPIKSECK